MATPRKNDSVKVNDSLASLEVEAALEPYRFALSGNKIIEFPDPTAMAWDAAENFLSSLETASASEVLEKWLSEEDFATLKAEKLNLRHMNALMGKVTAYYSGAFGSQGNE